MNEPPGDGGRAAPVEIVLGPDEMLITAVLAAGCLALLVALFRRGFLDYRKRVGPTEPPLWGGQEILSVLGAYFFASIFFGVLLGALVKGPLDLFGRAAVLLALLVLSWSPAVGLILYHVRRGLGQPISALGFRPVPWRAFIGCVGLYVLILVPLSCATIAWHLLLREAGADLREQDVLSLFREAAREGDVASFAAMAAMAAIVAPVCEEIFFRGFFFGASREKRGAVLAAVASSLAFAVVHFSLSAAAPIFLLGLVLCAIYQRTGSLYAGIFLHSLFNGVSLVMTTYDVVRSAA